MAHYDCTCCGESFGISHGSCPECKAGRCARSETKEKTMTELPPGATAVTQDQIDKAQGRQPFLERMRVEYRELVERINRAEEYIRSDAARNLTRQERELLSNQLGHMHGYAAVLSQRIDLY